MICHDHKFIYLPLGHDYDKIITDLLIQESSVYDLLNQEGLSRELEKPQYKDYTGFAFVRDPFGLCYEFQQKHQAEYPTLKAVVSSLKGASPAIKPQLSQIKDFAATFPLKTIGKVEKINRNLRAIVEECGVKLKEYAQLPQNFHQYIGAYDEEDISTIKEYFEEDFQAFYVNHLHSSDDFKPNSIAVPQLIKNLSLAEEFIELAPTWVKTHELRCFEYLESLMGFKELKEEPLLYRSINQDKDIAFISLCTPEIYSYALPAQEILERYCQKQGYAAHFYTQSLDKSSHPTWSKAAALLNHIEDHQYVIWLDADAVILDENKKISDFTEKYSRKLIMGSYDIGSEHKDPDKQGTLMNGGVLFFKNNPYCINLLKRWRDFSLENDTPNLFSFGSDQEILSQLLKKSDPVGFNYKLFNMSDFNTDPRHVTKNTFIMHFLSYPDHLKSMFINYIHHSLLSNG